MRVCLTKFTDEIADFLTNETLKAIDYGILDLHHIGNSTTWKMKQGYSGFADVAIFGITNRENILSRQSVWMNLKNR